MMKHSRIDLMRYLPMVRTTDTVEYSGQVTQVVGLTVEASGPMVQIGELCHIYPRAGGEPILCEVVGFRDQKVLLMPYRDLAGISQGCRVVSTNRPFYVPVGRAFIGRVLNALGQPIDGKGDIPIEKRYPLDNDPPDPLKRSRIKQPLPMGIKALDAMLTIGRGQRVGIFAGSGVGKSTTLGMIARNAQADINVITLIGERGREVRDFLEKDLKAEGLKKSVLVVATSDQPALLRLKSAMVGTAIAEYFRDMGYNVLLMMDSLTRFAMAQREIGMATGEPPVSRGYTPSVYAILPRLLERSGASDKGTITGLYTVLVEGDDMNEPVADTVRGILDGHIVLSRKLANANHYPPIDVLASVSRVMPDIVSPQHMQQVGFIKSRMAVHGEAQDLINIGAYQKGSNPDIDNAIALMPAINALLRQGIADTHSYEEICDMLHEVCRQGGLPEETA